MKPKNLLSIDYLRDGICTVESNIETVEEAQRLGAALFQIARKDPMMAHALAYATRLSALPENIKETAATLAEQSALDKLSKEQKN